MLSETVMKQIAFRKGISPIIATLLLILIAIASGVIVYAYVVGFIGSSTTNAGGSTNTLTIDELTISSKSTTFPVIAYVRNLGPSAENFNTGFYLTGGSSSSVMGIAVNVTDSIADPLTNVSIGSSTTSGVLGISVTVTCAGATDKVGVSVLGSEPATQSCSASGSQTFYFQTPQTSLTFANQTGHGWMASITLVGYTLTAGTPAYIGMALGSGAQMTLGINQVGTFTLNAVTASGASSIASASPSPGSTYKVQVTGTDGASTTASAKAY